LDRLFVLADKRQEEGRLKSAFRLFLAAAKGGDSGCQINLGNFYSGGIGVKPNRAAALYWYKRAYRQNYCSAASNIAHMLWREGKLKQALAWYKRATKLGDRDANLEVAKICLQFGRRAEAVRNLERAFKSDPNYITQASREEAGRLLRRMRKERR
jgi:hypothetical protein